MRYGKSDRSTSLMGHSRRMHSVPVPINVRCCSKSDIIVRRRVTAGAAHGCEPSNDIREPGRMIEIIVVDLRHLFTDRASGATNFWTDSSSLITVPGSARPIHYPGKFCSNQRHGTGYDLGRA